MGRQMYDAVVAALAFPLQRPQGELVVQEITTGPQTGPIAIADDRFQFDRHTGQGTEVGGVFKLRSAHGQHPRSLEVARLRIKEAEAGNSSDRVFFNQKALAIVQGCQGSRSQPLAGAKNQQLNPFRLEL